MALDIVLDSCGHENAGWLHIYKSDPEFGNTYQMLLEGKHVPKFHLQDAFLCPQVAQQRKNSRCGNLGQVIEATSEEQHTKTKKDIGKWCEFHKSPTHNTSDSWAK